MVDYYNYYNRIIKDVMGGWNEDSQNGFIVYVRLFAGKRSLC